MELVNEWLPTGKFRNFDTTFSKDSTYEKELMTELPLTVHALHKSEMEYKGKFGHTIGRIQHIVLMSIIEIFLCNLSSSYPNCGTYPTWFPRYQALCSMSG